MIKRVNKALIIGTLCMSMLILTTHAHGEEKHISIGILPCTDVVMSFKKFNPLITYLEQQTGLKIKLIVPKDFAGLERAIINGDINFAFQDPHTYVKLTNLYDKGSLIRSLTLEGASSQSGVVIVRKDSLIRKVEDLKGKTVMFGPRLSTTKWVVAKLLFEESGIDIDKDLKDYSNGGCCEDIAFNVYLKAVDAGVICDHFLKDHSEKQKELGIDAQQIIVIGKTKAVPTRVFAACQEINKDVITKINEALLRLDKKNLTHKKILYSAELGGFQKSKDEDYNSIRMLIGAKRVE
ncbi:MAG: phosphate/phosphite/phosphonate ABC transporter substrate-binding protein [bacterium]